MSISFDLCLEATHNGHARLSGAALQSPQEFDPVACWNGSIDHVSDGILGGYKFPANPRVLGVILSLSRSCDTDRYDTGFNRPICSP